MLLSVLFRAGRSDVFVIRRKRQRLWYKTVGIWIYHDWSAGSVPSDRVWYSEPRVTCSCVNATLFDLNRIIFFAQSQEAMYGCGYRAATTRLMSEQRKPGKRGVISYRWSMFTEIKNHLHTEVVYKCTKSETQQILEAVIMLLIILQHHTLHTKLSRAGTHFGFFIFRNKKIRATRPG